MPSSPAPVAAVGGVVASELLDVTTDPSALDSTGFWIVMLPFEGEPLCARFARRRPMTGKPARRWVGPPPDAWVSSLDKDGFCERVELIRESIAAGDVYQVNLTRRLSAPLPDDADILALGSALAGGNPSPHAAVLRLPDHGIHVASASPERFLQREGRVVISQPIKGTAATADGFLDKDRAENVMIVDLVRNDLGRVCEWGSIEVPDLCAVEAHPGLSHLVSTIRGRLRPTMGWAELLGAAFPPGSVTGAPKLAALELIHRLETVPRGPYCGAIGWVDADNRRGDLNVAIRTFWFDQDQVHLGTGGGITWGSDPLGEWEETELKTSRLLQVASNQPVTTHQPITTHQPVTTTEGRLLR
ncbi:MAG: anthranilate synthase component I family protein [Actinobacteria bacterium]|nr:anthranilate synthase component I family protein [Actinomycetota bacterium]